MGKKVTGVLQLVSELESENTSLKAERDALAAQAATLLAAIDYVISGQGDYTDLSEATESTPQQCLAEIKAEAGRAGFISGAEMWCDCGLGSQYKADCLIDIEADADRYAAKNRNIGTWLKDSNVNGGKRQGGAE